MVDSPVLVRGKKLIRSGTELGRLKYRRDSYRFAGRKTRLIVSTTAVVLEDATYEIALVLPPRPTGAVARSKSNESQGSALPVRWSSNSMGQTILEPDPMVWDYDATLPGYPPSPDGLVDHSLVEVTRSGRRLVDEWTHVGVEIRDETRMRVRVEIVPEGVLPLVFAVRRWHLTKALLCFDVKRDGPLIVP